MAGALAVLTSEPERANDLARRLYGREPTKGEREALRVELGGLYARGRVLRRPDPDNVRNGWLWWKV